MNKVKKMVTVVFLLVICVFVTGLGGCGQAQLEMKSLAGDLEGLGFNVKAYSNDGNCWLKLSGDKVSLEGLVEDSESGELSSYIVTTIDGYSMSTCGSTLIFAEKGLEPVDIEIPQEIITHSDGVEDIAIIAKTLNEYKNMIGKSQVIIVHSQLGNPIEIYQGDKVTKAVADDLPKTTIAVIDGKALYVHRSNITILDKELIDKTI